MLCDIFALGPISTPTSTFLNDFKEMFTIFEKIHPPNGFRSGNGILRELIEKFKKQFPMYDEKILRAIGFKFICLRKRKINSSVHKRRKCDGKLMTTRSYRKLGHFASSR